MISTLSSSWLFTYIFTLMLESNYMRGWLMAMAHSNMENCSYCHFVKDIWLAQFLWKIFILVLILSSIYMVNWFMHFWNKNKVFKPIFIRKFGIKWWKLPEKRFNENFLCSKNALISSPYIYLIILTPEWNFFIKTELVRFFSQNGSKNSSPCLNAP